MIEIPFKWIDDRMIVLTGAELAEFYQREIDAVERRRNQVPKLTIEERLTAVEAKQR